MSNPESDLNPKLLGLLAALVRELTDDYEQAEAANKAFHDANPGRAASEYPFTQREIRQMKVDMWRAQVEFVREGGDLS